MNQLKQIKDELELQKKELIEKRKLVIKKQTEYLKALIDEVNININSGVLTLNEDSQVLKYIAIDHEGCMAYQVVLTSKGVCYREIDLLHNPDIKIKDVPYDIQEHGSKLAQKENMELISELEKLLE